MDVDRRCMAVLTVVCFIALSAGFVSVSGDADAADGIKVVSYDSREGQNGQLVLDAGLDAGNYSATIGSITYLGTCDPLTGIVTLSNPSDKAGTLSVGSYQVKLKNVDTKADEGAFTLNVFEVVFDPNGGTGNIDSIVAYGSVPAPDSKGLSNDGKTFLGWSKTRDATVAEFTDTLFVDSSFVLYAVWGSAAPQMCTVSVKVNDSSMGSVDQTKIENVPYGSEISVVGNKLTVNGTTVTADPAAKTGEFTFSFKSWSVQDKDEVTGDLEITATFEKTVNEYTVSVKVNDSSMGSVDQTKIENVPYGSEISVVGNKLTVNGTTVTADPAAKTGEFTFSFKSWSVQDKDEVTGDLEITATFEKTVNEYTVSVKVNDSSMGSYTLTVDGVAISSGDSVEYGKIVMLSIVQNEGYKLTLLKDNNMEVDPSVLPHYFVVKENHVIEIGFTATSEIPYIVTVNCGDGGSISPAPKDGKYTLYGGQSMDFVVTADFGWKIKSVKLDGVDQKFDKISATVTISKIDAEHAISVEFEKAETYEVVVGDSSHGDVSVTGLDANGKAVEGRTVTVTATPDFGYYACKYLVNGVDVGVAAGTGSFTIDVDGNLKDGTMTIQVVFMLSSSGDDDDDPVPQPPTPSVPDTGDDDDDDSIMLVAVAAACVIVAIIALYMLAERRN